MKIRQIAALLALSTALVSCGGQEVAKGKKELTVAEARETQWKTVNCDSLTFNPITKFRDEWFLLASGNKEAYNAMTIAWGTMGELWGKNVVNVYVSASRHTFGFMEKNEFFTITAFPKDGRQMLQYMGSHSGRDIKDKAKEAGLTVEFTDKGNPVFKESNLAIECRLLYRTELDTVRLDEEIVKQMYRG